MPLVRAWKAKSTCLAWVDRAGTGAKRFVTAPKGRNAPGANTLALGSIKGTSGFRRPGNGVVVGLDSSRLQCPQYNAKAGRGIWMVSILRAR